MSRRVELLALETVPRVMPGDDLAGAILAACDREGVAPLASVVQTPLRDRRAEPASRQR